MLRRWTAIALFFCTLPCFAADEREIAITIDDLPFVGSGTSTPASLKRTQDRFMAIVKALVDNQVPATGFVIGGAVAKNEWDLLETFRNQGFALGNHTYTHDSLNSMSANKYIADIERADVKLAPVLTEPKYFRYPYLAEGNGEKKQQVVNYLAAHQYTIAPVTIDSKDYEFNAQFYRIPYRKRAQNINQFKKRYLAYIWKQTLAAERRSNKFNGQPIKQILLIHANLLNSYCLEDIIEMYKKNGYKFISLADALRVDTVQPLNASAESSNLTEQTPKEAVVNKVVAP
ncbi:polysaccharide deacetylase family protein [Legionella rowbothamii]|uniref:polysaccharide deacetylase family protein n=1 Tax=Legionella rowbothamii TaxID=96229 RepID=UPI001055FA0D|nr:polysaccharide deacetylase family protein [Legionella rowbothamii]